MQLRPPTAHSQRCLAQNLIFVESAQVHRGQIIPGDAAPRLDRRAEDTVATTRTFAKIIEEAEASYAF